MIDAPSFATVGVPFTQQPAVRVVNADGATVTSATNTVTLTKVSGSGSLTCTGTSVAAVVGRAAFTGCRIDAAGTYTLIASATGITSGSHTITVQQPVVATQLVFGDVPPSVSVGEKFTLEVFAQNAAGVTDTARTGTVTLSARVGALDAPSGRVTASFVDGKATFTGLSFLTDAEDGVSLTAIATDLTLARASIVVANVTATQLVLGGVPTSVKEGERFAIQVFAQDDEGRTDTLRTGSVFLSGVSTGVLNGAFSAEFVGGVATFAGLSTTHRAVRDSFGFISLSAESRGDGLRSSSAIIQVTEDHTPAYIAFSQQPGDSVSGVPFTTQPQVAFYNAAGRVLGSGTVTVTLGKAGDGTTTTTLASITSLTVEAFNGIASFSGVSVTGADTKLELVARSGELSARSQPFNVYATANALQTASSSVPSARFDLGSFSSSLTSSVASALGSGICTGSSCLQITSGPSASNITQSGTQTATLAQTATLDPLITIGTVDMEAFVAAHAAPSSGTNLLQGLLVQARDDNGLLMEALPAGMVEVLTFTVAPGQLPADTPLGDLRVVEWTGSDWRTVHPATVTANADGSFTLTAESGELTVFGVLFAPGGSAITGLTAFSASGIASGVFTGGSVNLLAHAIGIYGADSAWVQRNDGAFSTLTPTGPAFLVERFRDEFGGWLFENTPVFLTRILRAAVASPAAASAGATTHVVLPGETLSAIGARYGVPWMSIAEANGIAGPNYAIRDGLVLTIPAR